MKKKEKKKKKRKEKKEEGEKEEEGKEEHVKDEIKEILGEKEEEPVAKRHHEVSDPLQCFLDVVKFQSVAGQRPQ